jgi:putative ABC transport system permease protein
LSKAPQLSIKIQARCNKSHGTATNKKTTAMFRSWLTTAWRYSLNSRLYTLLNLSGLAAGAAVSLLIALWVRDELTFNTVHDNYDHIAQVMDNAPADGTITTSELLPIPLAAELRKRQYFSRVALYWPDFRHILTTGERSIAQPGSWVQPDLPVMLTLPMVRGNRDALLDRSNVLIAQSLATALFGKTDPINQNIRVDNTIEVRVGGVFEDLPGNSTFHNTKIFLSLDKAIDEMSWLKGYGSDWTAHGWKCYVQLNDNADLATVDRDIAPIMANHTKAGGETIFLHPMRSWHLYGTFVNGLAAGGRIGVVRLFAGIGAFVLLLACINFMNIATARSQRRAKEVGIRKVTGSLRYQLIAQFLGEALIMTILASVLALGIVQLSLSFFNELAGKRLIIPWTDPLFAVLTLAFMLVTALLAGSYPAFFLSGFSPIGAFRRQSGTPRKVLVVVQFIVSMSLVSGTLLIGRQIDYARGRPIGFSRTGLVNIGKNTGSLYDAPFDALCNDLLHTGAVSNLAEASVAAAESPEAGRGVSWQGLDTTTQPSFTGILVTPQYGRTMGWELVAGRDFLPQYATDSNKAIINQSAAKLFGHTQPLGKRITAYGSSYTIIGIVRDMVIASPFQRVRPGLFLLAPDKSLNDILIRLKPGTPTRPALTAIEKVFKKYNPASPFDYNFVDTDYAQKFADEEHTDGLAHVFTLLAIFISGLGLFGLAAYTAEQRIREIGIRKILGSSVFSIWRLLTGEIVLLVLLACAIALPLAALFMHHWLSQYEYRPAQPWWLFAATVAGGLALALFTVSFHALKAAHSSPVKTLRSQ